MPNVHFPMVINSVKEMQIIFRIYRQYLQYIIAIKLYVDLEEIIAEASRAGLHHNETIQSTFPIGQDEETVHNSYQVSHLIVYYIKGKK